MFSIANVKNMIIVLLTHTLFFKFEHYLNNDVSVNETAT